MEMLCRTALILQHKQNCISIICSKIPITLFTKNVYIYLYWSRRKWSFSCRYSEYTEVYCQKSLELNFVSVFTKKFGTEQKFKLANTFDLIQRRLLNCSRVYFSPWVEEAQSRRPKRLCIQRDKSIIIFCLKHTLKLLPKFITFWSYSWSLSF